MRHFSDPFAKAVYDTISGGAGVTWPELQELHQDEPEEPGQLRNTLAELRAAGAITSHSGKYWVVEEAPGNLAETVRLAKVETTYGTELGPAATRTLIKPAINIKEKDMSGTNNEGVRARVFEALKKAGTGNRDDMAMATGLSLKAVTDALYGLRAEGKTRQIARASRGAPAVYAPADSGRSPGVDIDRAARKAAKAVKAAKAAKPKKATKARAAAPVPAVSAATRSAPMRAVPAAPAGFRVGLFSDGTLSIVDADCEMQIDQNKTRALFNYLDTFQAMFTGASA